MINTEEISEIGLGTNRLHLEEQESRSLQTIDRAIDGDINWLDTSPIAGDGHNEMVIGNWFDSEHNREEVFLSSKCGYEWDLTDDLHRDTSERRMVQELEGSMNRLSVDMLDLYSLISPPSGVSLERSVETLIWMRDQRNVRNIGLSNPSDEQLQTAVEVGVIDFVQVPYNFFHRDRFKKIRSICGRNSIGLIAYDLFDYLDDREADDDSKNREDRAKLNTYSKKLRFVMQFYFEENYPNEAVDLLMANWVVKNPDVSSGVVEVTSRRSIDSIVRFLEICLSDDDYRAIGHIMSEFRTS